MATTHLHRGDTAACTARVRPPWLVPPTQRPSTAATALTGAPTDAACVEGRAASDDAAVVRQLIRRLSDSIRP